MKIKLVADAKDWARWWSMRWILASVFFSSVMVAYATLPADFLPAIPGWFKQVCGVGALFSAGAAAVSRVIQQPSLEK